MKKFGNYQWVPGAPRLPRDEKEEGSKFWNIGKWDNFVLPFLPKNCKDMTFIDVGCNAGVFLKLAEDLGFSKVMGVDSNKEAVRKNQAYRKSVGGKWSVSWRDMKYVIDRLPASDYLVMAMTHYYFPIDHWLEFLDKLQGKAAHCIIVTAKKSENRCKAGADSDRIRDYFSNWKEIGHIPELPFEGDPFPRRQSSFCFKSPSVERVEINMLDIGNQVQKGFYAELDRGADPFKSRYYRILKPYRLTKNPESRSVWLKEKLTRYMNQKIELYNSIKKNGLLRPITVDEKWRVVDGNHRVEMIKHLGHKTILARRVL